MMLRIKEGDLLYMLWWLVIASLIIYPLFRIEINTKRKASGLGWLHLR
jgi:hypothetical protein